MTLIQKYRTKRAVDRAEKKEKKEYWKEKRDTIRKEAEGHAKIKGYTERLERIKQEEKTRAERKYCGEVERRSPTKTVKKVGKKAWTAAKKKAVNYVKKQHEINQNAAKKKTQQGVLKKKYAQKKTVKSAKKKAVKKTQTAKKQYKAPNLKPPKFNF